MNPDYRRCAAHLSFSAPVAATVPLPRCYPRFSPPYLFAVDDFCQSQHPAVGTIALIWAACFRLRCARSLCAYLRGGLAARGETGFCSAVSWHGLGDWPFLHPAAPGIRLTILITQCLPHRLPYWPSGSGSAQDFWRPAPLGRVILGGVAVALMPGRTNPPRVSVVRSVLSSVCSPPPPGFGAVVSRKANVVSLLDGQPVDGSPPPISAPSAPRDHVRLFRNQSAARPAAVPASTSRPALRDYLWILANAGCGAIIGVSCYQWALFTKPSASCCPSSPARRCDRAAELRIEGERPTRRSLFGGAIAAPAPCLTWRGEFRVATASEVGLDLVSRPSLSPFLIPGPDARSGPCPIIDINPPLPEGLDTY